MIDIVINNQAKSFIKNDHVETPNTSCTVDKKFTISTEAVIRSKVMKMHAIKLWNLKSLSDHFKSKQNRNKQSIKAPRFDKALHVLECIQKSRRT